MSDDRDIVVARIREALENRREGLESPPETEEIAQLLPAVGDLLEDFSAWMDALSGEIRCCPEAELGTTVAELAKTHGWQRPAIHEAEMARWAIGHGDWADGALVWGADDVTPEMLERCDVGITTCAALVAQTGSVLVDTKTAGGRVLSILPPHHLVIARREQLVADLPAAMALVDGEASMISLHTGPSRTGDIERILVLGAHGPKQLTVVVVDG